MKRLHVALLLFLVGFSINSFSQGSERDEELKRVVEQQRRNETLRVLDSAVALMDDGKYELADKKLLYVLNNIKSIPSDLTFYFGKNSYYINKYKQSIDWLNKYIQLKGPNGQYSQEAASLLKNAEAEYLKEKTAYK